MTSLRFVGDFPVWLGLALAFVVGVLSWRYYRRESFDLPHRLRWFLPLLRSLAFFLGVMVLTGPVLHHRQIMGELGRVTIYVDASQSMGLLDRHLTTGRKLLIAERQGWLDPGRVDGSLLELADRLADARQATLLGVQSEDMTAQRVEQLRSSLLSDVKQTRERLSQLTTLPELTWNEALDSQLIQPLEAISQPTEPVAIEETVARLTAVCAALGPLEEQLRRAFDDDVQRLIDTGDESLRTALVMFDETPRWRRAERSLLETAEALLAELRQYHNVELLALHDQTAVPLFDGSNATVPATRLLASPDGKLTDLASGVASSQKSVAVSEAEGTDTDPVTPPASTKAAMVLLSDGQHNSGPSPLRIARVLGSQGIAFYPVSFGANQPAPDIAVTGLEHPEMVFQKDRVRGTMIIRDLMPVGQPMVAEIAHAGEVLWREQLVTENSGTRRIEFEFGIDELVQRLGSQFASDVRRHAVSLALTATIAPLQGEAETANNQRTFRFAAITENYRLLLIDGRSRWETRYLRNAFERDTQWDVNVVMAGQGGGEPLPRGRAKEQFPDTRDSLFEYDLIVFGEVAAELFAEHEFTWLREFVATRGGGIVFIDGPRGRLAQFTEQNLRPLLPVEWLPATISTSPALLQLTDSGAREPALTFEVETQANRRFWNELPAPHTLSNVAALPGAEVLLEAMVDGEPRPAMVTRRFGAGRVLYLAFDETWRWRYKAADTYHQRIWNQLAKFVMPRPFAASDDYVSIDTGPVSYQAGDSPDLRIRLMGLNAKPALDATVDALVWRDGQIVSTISLVPDSEVPGIYRGRAGALGEGEYEVSVRASGFSESVLKARGQFVVLPPESGELENTASNEALLRQMAVASGGVFLREEQMNQLSALLLPLSSGRVVETETLLWQSYWWFATIIVLLTLEWFLRKRAGLM